LESNGLTKAVLQAADEEHQQASPLHRNLYTLYFYTYFGHMFFCFSGIFRISGINLSHLGADSSNLGAKKHFRGVKYP
jgi:hypothetical protein